MWKTVLSYSWEVFWKIVYLAVIAYVFDHLDERPERIIVATLGMMYVSHRTFAAGQATMLGKLALDVDDIRERLKLAADDSYHRDPEIIEELGRAIKRREIGGMIEMLSLAIVGLICLYQLSSAL